MTSWFLRGVSLRQVRIEADDGELSYAGRTVYCVYVTLMSMYDMCDAMGVYIWSPCNLL